MRKMWSVRSDTFGSAGSDEAVPARLLHAGLAVRHTRRSSTFQRISAPYPWFVSAAKPPTGVSAGGLNTGVCPAAPIIQLFFAVSAPTVMVVTCVFLLNALDIPFHVPNTSCGDTARPPPCQSPQFVPGCPPGPPDNHHALVHASVPLIVRSVM